MCKARTLKLVTVTVGALLLAGTTGCNPLWVGTNTASFVTGWLFGAAMTAGPVERQCFQNGVLIDCADLPAN